MRAQRGLTMRNIEMIGLKKKLVTTNKDIIHYDFYNPQNICIIDRSNPIIPDSFIKLPYLDIPQEIYQLYYIESWIRDVLSLSIKNESI